MAVPHGTIATLTLLEDIADAQFRLERAFRHCTDVLAYVLNVYSEKS